MLRFRLSSLLHAATIDRARIKPRSDGTQLILTTPLLTQKCQENAPNSTRYYYIYLMHLLFIWSIPILFGDIYKFVGTVVSKLEAGMLLVFNN